MYCPVMVFKASEIDTYGLQTEIVILFYVS